jgi:hypothetical protein
MTSVDCENNWSVKSVYRFPNGPKFPSCRAFLTQHPICVTYCVRDVVEAFSLNFAHELTEEIALGTFESSYKLW